MPEDVQAVLGLEPGEMAVGQVPVAGLRRAVEGEAQPMSHRRMGAVAADQPVRGKRLALAVRLAQHGFDAVAQFLEALQRDGAFDLDALLLEAFLQDTLGVALGDHQCIGVGALDIVEADPRDDVPAVGHLRAMRLQAGRQERLDVAAMVEQLEGAAPQHQRLRLVGSFGVLVDDADRNAVARELICHRQADGAGSRNENSYTRRHSMPPIFARFQRGVSRGTARVSARLLRRVGEYQLRSQRRTDRDYRSFGSSR